MPFIAVLNAATEDISDRTRVSFYERFGHCLSNRQHTDSYDRARKADRKWRPLSGGNQLVHRRQRGRLSRRQGRMARARLSPCRRRRPRAARRVRR